MVILPGCQFAGQTSPCKSVNWKALTRRIISSIFLPTGRSFTVICLETQRESSQAALIETVDSLPQSATRIDDEKCAKWNSSRKKHAVVSRHLLAEVGDDWDLHVPKSSFRPLRIDPSQVSKFRIATRSNHLPSKVSFALKVRKWK